MGGRDWSALRLVFLRLGLRGVVGVIGFNHFWKKRFSKMKGGVFVRFTGVARPLVTMEVERRFSS